MGGRRKHGNEYTYENTQQSLLYHQKHSPLVLVQLNRKYLQNYKLNV